jgi:hypothetical protein
MGIPCIPPWVCNRTQDFRESKITLIRRVRPLLLSCLGSRVLRLILSQESTPDSIKAPLTPTDRDKVADSASGTMDQLMMACGKMVWDTDKDTSSPQMEQSMKECSWMISSTDKARSFSQQYKNTKIKRLELGPKIEWMALGIIKNNVRNVK